MRRIALLLCLACACTTTAKRPKRTDSQQADYDRAVKEGRVLHGMTKTEVRKSRGNPQKIDRVKRYGGEVLRWTYAWDEIYFDATGTVVGWQKAY